MEQKTKRQILCVEDLQVIYHSTDETVQAVNGVSFSLEYGKTLGLVGETGAGKTTIAKAILRILPDPQGKVVNGRIRLDDIDLLTLPEDEMRKIRGGRISMIFQDPMTALNPIMRVGSQIADGIRLHQGLPKAEASKRAQEMLEMVGIPAERFREYPHQFSGGMKQRVIIAMALACNPNLLIADEPTSALDVTIQAQVMKLIKKLQKNLNTAVIMITHDFGIIAETCDTVGVMYAGQIVEYGTKEQIFKNATHPYTHGLFQAIPRLNQKVRRLNPVKGIPADPTQLPQGCLFAPRCEYMQDACTSQHIPMTDLGDGHLCRCLRCCKAGTGKTDDELQTVVGTPETDTGLV